MSQITISQSAIDKIINNPKFRQSKQETTDSKLPLLYYYQRSYLTQHDGTIVEYGDGFMLTFVDKDELKETTDIIYKVLDIGGGNSVVVGGPQPILSKSFSIEWANSKFTLKPDVST